MNTMECGAARRAMLEADIEELEGAGTTVLAAHVSICRECRTHAQRILRGYADLERGMAAFASAPKRTWRLPQAAIPLAAAAVLAALLIPQDEPMPDIALVTTRLFQEQPVVMPPDGKQAIIIEKNDLTVVWLY